MNTQFKSITINGWRQYSEVEINFHDRLTVITGPNGAGKSTILSLISKHFGYNRQYLSTPSRRRRRDGQSFLYGLFDFLRPEKRQSPKSQNQDHPLIGQMGYSNDQTAEIRIHKSNSINYAANVQNQQPVQGIHIDSHRPPSLYGPVSQISTTAINVAAIGAGLSNELRNYYQGGRTNQSTLFHIKTALISMSIFGHGNETMEPKPELVKLLKEFQSTLRIILPKSLGFQQIVIRSPEVILDTKTGSFILDACSGGIIKLFEIAWELFFFSKNHENFVVTMDEPENHLHPSLQRSFLSDMIKAFPTAQFIVVTHSPFIVSSVRDSSVYVLGYENLQVMYGNAEELTEFEHASQLSKVRSIKLDTINKAGTASAILREALGVPTTIPDWAEERAADIIRKYTHQEVTQEMLDRLFGEFEAEGLVAEYPAAIEALTKRQK